MGPDLSLSDPTSMALAMHGQAPQRPLGSRKYASSANRDHSRQPGASHGLARHRAAPLQRIHPFMVRSTPAEAPSDRGQALPEVVAYPGSGRWLNSSTAFTA